MEVLAPIEPRHRYQRNMDLDDDLSHAPMLSHPAPARTRFPGQPPAGPHRRLSRAETTVRASPVTRLVPTAVSGVVRRRWEPAG
ncbi:hypothetical protein Axi01nite_22460 [Actinoplanes xinjiangensis]|nr:hypothetical protein Axi01nite_22460 [Actinoplanes xinjiangensis]